jgi:MSHA biogenesis protein MshP
MRRQRQRGMSLVVAIFLVTVIASLAAFAVSTGSASRSSLNLQLLSDRALAAARAGAEWGAYQALTVGACAGSTNLALNQGALRGFAVRVQCTARTGHTESGFNYVVADITSTATWSTYGQPDYVYRQVVSRYNNGP